MCRGNKRNSTWGAEAAWITLSQQSISPGLGEWFWQLLKSHYCSSLCWEVFPLKPLIISVFVKYKANLMTTDLQGEKWSFHLLHVQLWCHSADAGSSRGVISSGPVALLGHSTTQSLLSCPWGEPVPGMGLFSPRSHTWQRGIGDTGGTFGLTNRQQSSEGCSWLLALGWTAH